jgi:hypothetical protein
MDFRAMRAMERAENGGRDGCRQTAASAGPFRSPGSTVKEPLTGIEDTGALTQAIVDTVREPLLVLDSDLRVVTASRSFYLTFRVDRQDVQGRL